MTTTPGVPRGTGQPLHVGIVHHTYRVQGGEDVCVQNEMAALREAGLQVTEFRVEGSSSAALAGRAIAAPFGRGTQARVEKEILANPPAILHVHNLFPSLSPRLFGPMRHHGIKTVLTLHNYRPLCLNGLFLTPRHHVCERCAKGNYLHGVLRGCYRNDRFQSLGLAVHLGAARALQWYDDVDLLIAPSAFLKMKFVAAGFPHQKLVVQGHFAPGLIIERPEPPEPYVLYLGRLSPEKGVGWLLKTFQAPQHGVTLKIAGRGPMQRDVAAASGLPREYLGYLEEPEKGRFLRKALAIVLASDCYENFPMAVVEANALGVPALVPHRQGLADMVSERENGFHFAPEDASSFWEAVQEILGAPRLRQTTLAYARSRFSKEQFLKRRMELYRSLVACTTREGQL